jgi:hypothetical protein
MPNANLIQTNFTAGEISPKLFGRYDVERYKNGVAELRNFLPLIQGGIKSTPMRRYNASAKEANKTCRLIRFEFSSTEANILEFGENYIRFFNQDRTQVMDGGSPYEIATVYSESELFSIEYVGGADTIFLFHQDHPVQRLRRFANDNWVIEDAPFDPQPFFEQGLKPSETLTLSSATVGTGRTFTAGASVFLEADVGRRITYLGGVALITGYTSGTVVTCTIESAFSTTSIAASVWTIENSPQAVCSVSANGAVGEEITLELSTGTVYGDEISIDSSSWSASVTTYTTAVNHGFSATNIVRLRGNVPLVHNGTYEIDNIPGASQFDVTAVDPGTLTTDGTVQLVTPSVTTNGWRSGDVGSFVEINGGLIEITAYTSATTVTGIVRQAMTSDAEAQAGAWTLNQGIWNAANGYPRCGTFFQQSLVCGGSPAFPHTVAKSRSGEYLNFELGVLDDDAFLYTLDVDEYDPILHLNKVKNQLLVLTSGSEFTLTGGVEAPMTPTNVQVANPSDYGSNVARPVRVESELIFVNRTGLKVRALGYQLQQDSFDSPDLTKLSDHITESGIKDIAYQQEPESIIWAVLNDGTMVTLCIDRKEGILAWGTQQPTSGTTYESVEVIPNDLGVDEIWCVVNTGTARYIESFDSSAPYGLASAISAISGTPTDTWSGLTHLEGETVEVVADGVIVPSETVSGGQITIDRAASQVYIGLSSHAYVKTLSPEFFTQGGSAQGNNARIGQINIQVLETYALLIDNQYRDERKFGSSLLDQAPPLFTGLFEVFNQDWQKRGFIEIQQPNALPVHILSIILQLTVNTK